MKYGLVIEGATKVLEYDDWNALLEDTYCLNQNGTKTSFVKYEQKHKYKVAEPQNELEHMIATIASLIPQVNIDARGNVIKHKNDFVRPHFIEFIVNQAIEEKLKKA